MKKRLTERIGDGIRYTNGEYNVTCYPKNNNLTPVDELAVKLCDIEDKIENGTLTEMPCKVGDTVYVITYCKNILMYRDDDYFKGTGAIECPFENSCDFEECDNSNLRIFETRVVVIHCEEDFGWTFYCEHLNKDSAFSEIGKTVFFTREEAEAVLAERKKSERDPDSISD